MNNDSEPDNIESEDQESDNIEFKDQKLMSVAVVPQKPKVSLTHLRLWALIIIAGASFVFLVVVLVIIVKGEVNPEDHGIHLAILITSLANILTAIIGVLAGTSIDSSEK